MRATITVTPDIRLKGASPCTHYTNTCCKAFGIGAVATCFYDLGKTRLGLEHITFRVRSLQRLNRLRHDGGHRIKIILPESVYY